MRDKKKEQEANSSVAEDGRASIVTDGRPSIKSTTDQKEEGKEESQGGNSISGRGGNLFNNASISGSGPGKANLMGMMKGAMVGQMKQFDERATQLKGATKDYDGSKDKINKALSAKQEQDMEHRIKTADHN